MRAMPPLASRASVIWSWRSRAVWGLVLVVEALETGILGGLAIVPVVGFGWVDRVWRARAMVMVTGDLVE